MAGEDIMGLLGEINSAAKEEPLSLAEKVMGYSRSYLAGPTFNFADNIEAAIAAPFTDKTYGQELEGIRTDQNRFKRNTDYLDNIVEIGSGALLNPVSELGALAKGANYGAGTAAKLLTNPVSQSIYSAVGADNGQDPLKAAGIGALVGVGGSIIANKVGGVLTNAERNADRLKTSAYGITTADISRQIKKMGDNVDQLADSGSIPLVRSLEKYEKAGVIDPSNDIIDNIKNLYGVQNSLGGKISTLLDQADGAIAPKADFGLDNTIAYIGSLSGTAKEKAAAAADAELNALIPDLGVGRLKDLQKLKIGLNYKFDQNPYADDVIKALRSDLRAEIEKRVDDAAKQGLLPNSSAIPGTLKYLNKEWGAAAELKDVFRRKAGNDFKGDPISDLIMGGATTGGTGTLNLAGAATGNPAYWGASAILNAAQVPAAKSKLADVLREADQLKLNKLGDVIEKAGTARNVEQSYEATKPPPPYAGKSSGAPITSQSLLDEINSIDAAAPSGTPREKSAQNTAAGNLLDSVMQGSPKTQPSLQNTSATNSNQYGFMNTLFKGGDMFKGQPVSDVIKAIKSDPVDHSIAILESGLDPKAKNPDSTAKGIFQLLDGTAKNLGVKNALDAGENYDGFLKLKKENAKFGSSPQMVYAAHYLGAPTLSKWLNGDKLTEAQTAQVKELETVLLPRLMKIYSKLTKDSGTVVA